MSAPKSLDWDWALRTGGNLSGADRRRLVRPLMSSLPRLAAEWARARTGRRGTASLNLDALTWPDSGFARAAETEAREVLSPHVLEHSYRSYLFGLVLSGIDGVVPDHETAFVACMLHDIQLEHPTPGRCFAVVGGERAYKFALDQDADLETAVSIAAGIAGHLTPGAADDLADLSGFVSAGALVDVVGARLQEMDRRWVQDVLSRHPRYGFKGHLTAAIKRECELVPDGRPSWLSKWAAFQSLIAAAPFPE